MDALIAVVIGAITCDVVHQVREWLGLCSRVDKDRETLSARGRRPVAAVSRPIVGGIKLRDGDDYGLVRDFSESGPRRGNDKKEGFPGNHL